MLRHVYYPSLRRHVPKTVAACFVFFVSAVFHELLVGVPLHMVRFWAFSGLMFQVRKHPTLGIDKVKGLLVCSHFRVLPSMLQMSQVSRAYLEYYGSHHGFFTAVYTVYIYIYIHICSVHLSS